MKPFEYFDPSSLKEALDLLDRYGDKAVIMAGGTDLIPALNGNTISPEYVIHIDKLNELRFIEEEKDTIKIGPLVTMNELLESDLIRTRLTALAEAAEASAAPQVRNLGTIGGNIGTSSPAGDLNIALAALGAKVTISSINNVQTYPIENFMTGPKKNILSKQQLITEIVVPNLPENSRSSFQKLGKRKAMTISVASAAAVVTVDPSGTIIQNARIALGSVAPTLVISKQYGPALRGLSIGSEEIKTLSELVKNEISPITDVRTTAEYRYEIAGVLAARCVENCLSDFGQ